MLSAEHPSGLFADRTRARMPAFDWAVLVRLKPDTTYGTVRRLSGQGPRHTFPNPAKPMNQLVGKHNAHVFPPVLGFGGQESRTLRTNIESKAQRVAANGRP